MAPQCPSTQLGTNNNLSFIPSSNNGSSNTGNQSSNGLDGLRNNPSSILGSMSSAVPRLQLSNITSPGYHLPNPRRPSDPNQVDGSDN